MNGLWRLNIPYLRVGALQTKQPILQGEHEVHIGESSYPRDRGTHLEFHSLSLALNTEPILLLP